MNYKNKKGYTILLLLSVFTFFFVGECIAQSRTFVTRGIFNARQADLASRRVALNGNWNFYPGKLLSPGELRNHKSISLMVPSLWNRESGLSNTGCGTYSLTLILPHTGEEWALEIPQLYNSYALYINGSLHAVNGRPAAHKDSTALQWKPQVVTFTSPDDTARIVLQVSNYHHFKGGIREPLFLGTAGVIRGHFSLSMISVWAEVAVLFVLALMFLYLFVKSRGRITLYFALLCIAWATRELFSDIYPISNRYPDINWSFLVKTEYATIFFISTFGVLFMSQLYRDLSSDVFKYLMVLINLLYLIFVLVTPVIIFSRWLPLYLITAAGSIVYTAILIVRAMLQEKHGASFLITGLLVSLVTIGYDLIAYEAALSNHVMVGSICYIVIFIACAIGLLQHLKIIRSSGNKTNTLRYQDLYR